MANLDDCQHVFILYVACILIFVGVFTPEWSVDKSFVHFKVTAGLFRSCTNTYCQKISSTSSADKKSAAVFEPGKLDRDDGLKSMAILGCLCAIVAAVAMTLHYLLKKQLGKLLKLMPTMTLIAAIAGAAMLIMACAVYGWDYFGSDVYPGYSYILTFVGAIFLIAGGTASAKK